MVITLLYYIMEDIESQMLVLETMPCILGWGK
jgi:hypothetical protein